MTTHMMLFQTSQTAFTRQKNMTWEPRARTTAYVNASIVGVVGEEECYLEVCGFYCMLSKENLRPERKGIMDAMGGDY